VDLIEHILGLKQLTLTRQTIFGVLRAIIFLNLFKNIDCFQTGRRLRHTCRNWTCDADWRHIQRDCQRALRISIQVSIKIVKHNFDKRFEVSR
jgi:hypothetical protein